MFGNDTDNLFEFPQMMLELPSLKTIEIISVYMSEDYLNQIKVKYPKITIADR